MRVCRLYYYNFIIFFGSQTVHNTQYYFSVAGKCVCESLETNVYAVKVSFIACFVLSTLSALLPQNINNYLFTFTLFLFHLLCGGVNSTMFCR